MPQPPTDALFEQAKISFIAGLDCFGTGEFAEAERHFTASLALIPHRASTLINLAATQLQLFRSDAALASANAALAIEPDSTEALLHRATAAMQLNRFDEALRDFDRLVAADKTIAEVWLRRARTLARLGRPFDAMASYGRTLGIDAENADAWGEKGSLHRELGQLTEAAHAFREALRLGASTELHAYYLSSVESSNDKQLAPPTAPREYVQGLFDDYADQFDEHLVASLHYSAHRRLVEGLNRHSPGPYTDALDIGCGTGLCGPLLRPFVKNLSGVDLSPRMLEKARALAVYDKLDVADAVDHLNAVADPFDLLVAADVFIYVGDLAPIFAAARRAMKVGVFCFSLELLPSGADDFRLLPSLRYAHSESYIERLASLHRFKLLAADDGVLREEQGRGIAGCFVYLGVA